MADDRDIWEKLLDEEDAQKNSPGRKKLDRQRQYEEDMKVLHTLAGGALGGAAWLAGRRGLRSLTKGTFGKTLKNGGRVDLQAATLVPSLAIAGHVAGKHGEGPLSRAERKRRK